MLGEKIRTMNRSDFFISRLNVDFMFVAHSFICLSLAGIDLITS